MKTKDNISEQGTQENIFSILGEHWNITGEQGNRYPHGRASLVFHINRYCVLKYMFWIVKRNTFVDNDSEIQILIYVVLIYTDLS